MEDSIAITQVDTVEVIEAQERAAYDIQIATAKRYPRDIQKSRDNSIVVATMNKQTAESCGYALPRGGRPIQGPSVHLAKIVAQNWGNLRIESKVVDITQTQVVSNAVCFDLENNIAVKVEVRRKITDRNGKRFNEDMITMTGNASNSIALRNAVFAVVPEDVTQSVYQATKNMLSGDLSTEEKMLKARTEAMKYYKDTYGATEEEILKMLGIGSTNAVKQDQIILMRSISQSIIDGDTTVDMVFEREKKPTPQEKKEALKKKGNTKPDMP